MSTNIFEQALYTKLTATSAITDLTSTRIYPLELPQDCTKPALVYQRIETDAISAFGQDLSTVRVRVQITCWSTTFNEVMALAVAVKNALTRWSGTYDNIVIQDTFLDSEYEDNDWVTNQNGIIQEYIVWFTQG